MQYRNNISAIEELASSENGVFTTAQAARFDIPRDALSHAARSGRIERIYKGVYRVSGSSRDELDELMAIWKLTNPSKFTYERVASFDGVAVGGTTAAWIHRIGDYWLTPYRLYAATRVNTRNKSASFAKRAIEGTDVEWKRGLPVTRVERTLYDLKRRRGAQPSRRRAA
jgi:predicted transcriptional regulator of viral defense system